MKYLEWEVNVPEAIRQDSVWRVEAYRLALFLADIAWHDASKLMKVPFSQRVAGQLYDSVGSVGANISEGYSRGTGRDRARFYEYALGSARECRHWYHQSRHALGDEILQHRLGILTQIIRLLLRMVPDQRQTILREEIVMYTTSNIPDAPLPIIEGEETNSTNTHVSRFTFPERSDLAQIESTIESGVVSRRGETVLVSGEGCWMVDSEGNRYLDLTSSQGVAMLGYGHPALSAAIAEQAQRLHACPGFFNNDSRARFLEALIGVMPGHLRHAFIANSGAEAIDGCIKFARLTTERTGIVAAKGSFHGRTIGAVSLTWNPKYRKPFEPLLPGVSHVKYNDLAELDAAISDETAAVVLEIVQGEGGVNLGEAEFLQGAQALCRERGALLVIDEIQTGFGRTGKWFGFQHFGLEPDLIALAKGVGAGFPMGAIVYTDRVQEALFVGAHGSTFGGNPLASAAGLAAIRAYQDENLIERAEAAGQRLRARLEETLADCRVVREIRGPGLMIGIDLRTKVGPYLKSLMEEYRVLTLPAGTTVLRLLPPLIISDEEIEIGVAAIAAALGG
ncbi:MAG: aminotransferase class III-fold pyridoxal phosphate-dependent enzyme [Caldilineaceae bacterium]|nr:aminotransferase class III-fold pyridoxal phosphate-dependent enzyme [Caldilineaceae bacterium]